MANTYREFKNINYQELEKEILEYWKSNNIFEKSINYREGGKSFVFYEGPPSANGMPGIHHVMARAIKDIFCRYKTLKGYKVTRKAGWDTHGLPVEMGVEKELGITKEDIGVNISVEKYNDTCRKEVMKYKDVWENLTDIMGYWIDMNDPYITFDNKYIESVWWILGELYKKDLLYKGYCIQPYSPAAGTGLSSHELNQPGCYKNVKDTTVVAQFKVENTENEYFLAWTTTPWTLPSNTALAVGKGITYLKVKTYNQYTFKPIVVYIAKDLFRKYFSEKADDIAYSEYKEGDKIIPFEIIAEVLGKDLEGVRYEQLMPYAQPETGDSFRVVIGDFVSTEDGTGIVHIAPSFGADDFRTGQQNGLGSLTLVDKQGKFIDCMGEFAGRYVKSEYDADFDASKDNTVDVDIAIKLKTENRAFKVEKYEHSYPHCWRTDKPILYYPLDSWFIKTTALKERLIELNKTINWKPLSTGIGRFGNWLENLVDWNLSRSRYWGIPLPIWREQDGTEEIMVNSIEKLYNEIEKSIKYGFMEKNPYSEFKVNDFTAENYNKIDIHRPYVDNIVLVSSNGKPMHREKDLIDVWFDSGSMPYAQYHYPFENKEFFDENFPADLIAEGVDQTRGWFFTMHAIAVMLFDKVSYKTCISNGLVLDKNGNKMSKRLGNAVDPFSTIEKYGADATRWYMMTNSQPWDNLKFDLEGIAEVQRKYFGTLINTYSFFTLYANIDNFTYSENKIDVSKRPEIDKWIISELNTLIKKVDEAYNDYEPTKAGRYIQEFVNEYLSNWYVRLSRRRFWKSDKNEDKLSAYQTLYECLETVLLLSSPISPFITDTFFLELNKISRKNTVESIHLAIFPEYDNSLIDNDLEERMQMAQKISSMILSLRKKENIRVRQPLQKIIIPVADDKFKNQISKVEHLIKSEVNVKEIEYVTETSGIIIKKIKPNFKTLGPKFGKNMKQIAEKINTFSQEDIEKIEKESKYLINIDGNNLELTIEDVEIIFQDIPGWLVLNEGSLTVALDITITEKLREEGIARDLVNRIQNIRKSSGFDVTDKIYLEIEKLDSIYSAISNYKNYICDETLTNNLIFVDKIESNESIKIEVDNNIEVTILVKKIK